jgi:hypothetical protein
MTPELLAMLGGSVSGFVMKMIAAQAENQVRLFERMLQKQVAADDSADRAAGRGGVKSVVVPRHSSCYNTKNCGHLTYNNIV